VRRGRSGISLRGGDFSSGVCVKKGLSSQRGACVVVLGVHCAPDGGGGGNKAPDGALGRMLRAGGVGDKGGWGFDDSREGRSRSSEILSLYLTSR